MPMTGKRRTANEQKRLATLVEEATVDAYGEEEQHSGLLTIIQDEVACPFKARVIGEDVDVLDFEWPTEGYGLYAVCKRNGKKYRVDVNSLEWVKPYPKGFEWIEAYLFWREGIADLMDDESE
jgi:hypothetical protein